MVCEHIHPDQEEDLPEIDEPAYELDDDTDDHAEYDIYSDEYIEDEDEDDSIIYKEHLVEYLPWRKVDLEHFLQQCLERTYDDEDLSAARADLIRTLELVQNTDMEDSKVDAIMNEIYDYLTY